MTDELNVEQGENQNGKNVDILVDYCFKTKANIDATTNDWQTPLHLASDDGLVEIIKIPLANRASINAKSTSTSEKFISRLTSSERRHHPLLLCLV